MRSSVALLAVAVSAVVVLILVESPAALEIALTDGVLAGVIIALAAIPGTMLLRVAGVRPLFRGSAAARGDGADGPRRCCVSREEEKRMRPNTAVGMPAHRPAPAVTRGRVEEEPLACRVIFGAGLGVGLLCLLEFTLGVCGALGRGWWGATFGGIVLVSSIPYAPGIRRLVTPGAAFELSRVERRHWLWLAVAPFAALALIVATAPPGVLWPAEGNGYDVLEYHLAVPKQYYQIGHIFFLPNNVYSNFPFNAEMLYLLAMVLKGGAIEGIMLAQMFNAATAFLFVAAMWAAARPFGSTPALLAALLAGTCGWLVYLSGVAYVENTMLLFTALAFGAWIRWASAAPPLHKGGPGGVERGQASIYCGPWPLLAGLFTGLACGCKYTAVIFIAIPLGVMFLVGWLSSRSPTGPGEVAFPPSPSRDGTRGIARALLLFALGVLVTFAPWLLKNAVFCGNPVFPMATAELGYRAGIWDKECEARWTRGHLPPPELRSLAGRLRMTWNAVIAEPLTGPALWLLAPLALALNARRCWPLAAVVTLQVILWAALTHLAERFAVPILPPLMLVAATVLEGGTVKRVPRFAALFGRGDAPPSADCAKASVRETKMPPAPHGQARPKDSASLDRATPDMALPERATHHISSLAYAAVLLGAAANLYHIGGLYYDRTRFRRADGRIEKIPWQGQVQWFTEGEWPGTAHLGFINRDLPADADVLLVADARSLYVLRRCQYCVVFNPNPFAKAIREAGDAVGTLAWLRRSGYTHVYVDWMEMDRLRATYGFWSDINEELFVRLEKVGLRRVKDFPFAENQRPYGTIYEVGP
jgi:hypothetical protein